MSSSWNSSYNIGLVHDKPAARPEAKGSAAVRVSFLGADHVNAPMPAFELHRMADRATLDEMLRLRWSGGTIFVRGKLLSPPDVEAFGVYLDGKLQGIATWCIQEGTLYLLTMDNITNRRGVSTALMRAVMQMGREMGLPFMRALLTNDNSPGFRFYQKRGFRIVAVHPGIVDMMRQLKPSIPESGIDGIPMRDEIEMEIVL